MDYRRPTIGSILSLTLIGLVASCSPSTPRQGKSFPDVLKWIQPDTDVVRVLSENPAECLSETAAVNPEILLGRAAFRSPFLLGGQALFYWADKPRGKVSPVKLVIRKGRPILTSLLLAFPKTQVQQTSRIFILVMI